MVKAMRRACATFLASLLFIASAHAAGFYVWDSGAWRSVANPYVWDSGAWRHLQAGWVWDSGAWRKFYSGCTPVTHTYTAGSGSEVVPTGIANVTIIVEGGGGFGGSQDNDGSNFASGGGGGAGGDAVSSYSVSSGDWGGSLSYAISTTNSAHGPASAGTPLLSVPTGTPGGNAPDQFNAGPGNGGSTGSGGNISNSTGAAGSSGFASTGSVFGGAGGVSTYGYGNGGNGTDSPSGPFNPGGTGVVIYQWTC